MIVVALTLAACARVHTVCGPRYAYEAYRTAQEAYQQCLMAAPPTREGTASCVKPEEVPRSDADLAQCDYVVALCKAERLW